MTINVRKLWDRIEALEAEARFKGKAYPFGMCAFPFRLRGQGFFPGGDGLWRDDASVSSSNEGFIEQGGVLFLGNDFGTMTTYEKLRGRSYENPPTWRNVKRRVVEAEIPPHRAFFTNSILGLRTEGTALSKKSWQAMPQFAQFCREFLAYQFEVLQPVLTVVMGPDAQEAFESLGERQSVGRILFTTHPYPDHMNSVARMRETETLKNAWQDISSKSSH